MATLLSPLSCLFVLGHQAVRGMSRPLVTAQILAYTYADKRATVLSLNSLLGRLFFTITGPLIGVLVAQTSLPTAIGVQGLILLGIFSFLAWRYTRIDPKYFRFKPESA